MSDEHFERIVTITGWEYAKTEIQKAIKDSSDVIETLLTNRYIIIDTDVIDREMVVAGVRKFLINFHESHKELKDIPIEFMSDSEFDIVMSGEGSTYTDFITKTLGGKK